MEMRHFLSFFLIMTCRCIRVGPRCVNNPGSKPGLAMCFFLFVFFLFFLNTRYIHLITLMYIIWHINGLFGLVFHHRCFGFRYHANWRRFGLCIS